MLMGGVEYLGFEGEALDDHDRFVLSNLSATYALFAVTDGALTPVLVEPLRFYGDDLITIQRYSGKTNEQFTHLLVNVAVAVSAAAHERTGQGLAVRLLDPLAGRGTTLNRGLMYGFDVAGIDVDRSDFDAYRGYLTNYLKNGRRSFKTEESTPRSGPLAGSRRLSIRIDNAQRIDMVLHDTIYATNHFGERSFDVLVGDLPYGARHGSTAGGKLRRSPVDLVAESLDSWRGVLRSGAGVALAWNTKTLARVDFEAALGGAGFHVLDTGDSFVHRVDRTITRDVVLATT